MHTHTREWYFIADRWFRIILRYSENYTLFLLRILHQCNDKLNHGENCALIWKRTFVDTRIIHDRLCTDRSTSGSNTLGAVTRILSCLRSSRKCSFAQVASLRNIEPIGIYSSTSSISSFQSSRPKPQTRFRHRDIISQSHGFVAMLNPILENADESYTEMTTSEYIKDTKNKKWFKKVAKG